MRRKEIIISIALSLAMHAIMLLLLLMMPEFTAKDQATPIEVFLEEPKGGWQIADIPKPAEEEKPEQSKFLGVYNQRVQEETVAQRTGRGDKTEGKGDRRNEGAQKKTQTEEPKKTVTEKGSDIMRAPVTKKAKEKSNEATALLNSKGGTPGVSDDFYPDFKYGNRTYINVLRYPDVEYFVRLKRIFKMTWNPVPALRHDMQTMTVSRGAVSVVLGVSVDGKGELAELFILRSSGLPAYDDEALRTVRSSAPFSSPPEKFLKDNGVLRMSWTFVIYI
jgi:TonB family protein